jgi:hypothetical protein
MCRSEILKGYYSPWIDVNMILGIQRCKKGLEVQPTFTHSKSRVESPLDRESSD